MGALLMSDQTVSEVSVTNVTVTDMLFRAGTVTLPAGTNVSISWTAFPTAALGVVLSSDGSPASSAFAISFNASGAVLNAGGSTVTVNWLAYGN